MYPTATRYPGPANASAFFHHAPRLTGTVRYTSARLGVSRGCRQPVSRTLFAIAGPAEQQQRELLADDARRAVAQSHDRGAVERLSVDHREAYARRQPLLGEIMQARGMLVADFLQHHAAADFALGERDKLRFFDLPCRRRNRRAMRVVAGLAERIRQPRDQLLAHRSLQPLGFDVHVTPVVTEFAREIRFEDAVPADHLECGAAALRGELHAAIGHVLDESRFGQPFHHATHGRTADVDHLRYVAGRRETA